MATHTAPIATTDITAEAEEVYTYLVAHMAGGKTLDQAVKATAVERGATVADIEDAHLVAMTTLTTAQKAVILNRHNG